MKQYSRRRFCTFFFRRVARHNRARMFSGKNDIYAWRTKPQNILIKDDSDQSQVETSLKNNAASGTQTVEGAEF